MQSSFLKLPKDANAQAGGTDTQRKEMAHVRGVQRKEVKDTCGACKKKRKEHEKSRCVTYRDKEVTKHMPARRDEDRELKGSDVWSHGLKLELNISHARTEVSPGFSN